MVDKGPDNNGYCDLSIVRKDGWSLNVPGNTEFLGEFIIRDGIREMMSEISLVQSMKYEHYTLQS
jgi:hypothetical protein